MNIQEQEEMDHGLSGVFYCGGVYASNEEAMIAAGGDTAATLEGEAEWHAELAAADALAAMDAMEARGGPVVDAPGFSAAAYYQSFNDCPF
jgi:hypothetical protein